jgi:hypothetical protein
LKNDDLLKRIRQAGGQRTAEEPREPSPQRNGDRQAGAYYDPEFEEDDFDDDPFDDGDIEIEFDQKPDVDFDRVGGMESVKEDIRMKILYPLENRELFEAYGKLAADSANTLIIPSNMSDVSGLVTSLMKMVQTGKAS